MDYGDGGDDMSNESGIPPIAVTVPQQHQLPDHHIPSHHQNPSTNAPHQIRNLNATTSYTYQATMHNAMSAVTSQYLLSTLKNLRNGLRSLPHLTGQDERVLRLAASMEKDAGNAICYAENEMYGSRGGGGETKTMGGAVAAATTTTTATTDTMADAATRGMPAAGGGGIGGGMGGYNSSASLPSLGMPSIHMSSMSIPASPAWSVSSALGQLDDKALSMWAESETMFFSLNDTQDELVDNVADNSVADNNAANNSVPFVTSGGVGEGGGLHTEPESKKRKVVVDPARNQIADQIARHQQEQRERQAAMFANVRQAHNTFVS